MAKVEWETLQWVSWYNTERLPSAIGHWPSQEVEDDFHAEMIALEHAAQVLNKNASQKPEAVQRDLARGVGGPDKEASTLLELSLDDLRFDRYPVLPSAGECDVGQTRQSLGQHPRIARDVRSQRRGQKCRSWKILDPARAPALWPAAAPMKARGPVFEMRLGHVRGSQRYE
jgi:hypothetical protein